LAAGRKGPHDSDVDIGIYLMPPAEGADWALALYTAEGDAWQRELGGLLGKPVSLEAVSLGGPGHEQVQAGKLLWARPN